MIYDRLQEVKCEPGFTLFEQGTRSNKVWIISDGKFDVVMKNSTGTMDVVVDELHPG